MFDVILAEHLDLGGSHDLHVDSLCALKMTQRGMLIFCLFSFQDVGVSFLKICHSRPLFFLSLIYSNHS